MSIHRTTPEREAMRTRSLDHTLEESIEILSARMELGKQVVQALQRRGYTMPDITARDFLLNREISVPIEVLADLLDIETIS